MSTTREQNERMIAYLLGELSEAESSAMEEQYLSDEDNFQELLAIEAELRDSYARGILSPDRRRRFAERLLNNETQLQRLEFSRALIEVGSPPRRRLLKSIMLATGVAATLIITIPLAWTVWQRNVPPKARLIAAPPTQNVVAFALIPGSTRGTAQELNVEVPAGTDLIRLNAEIDQDSYPSYQAVLRTPEGVEIFRKRAVRPAGVGASKAVVLDIPASLLQEGHYAITVSGEKGDDITEDIADYSFRLVKH